MEFWTRDDDQLCWKEWPDAVQGLARLPASRLAQVLLFSLEPDAELPSLVATVHLVRKLVGRAVTLIIASPHPSEEWVRPLRESGIDHVWLVERPGSEERVRSAPTPVQEIKSRICPALHSHTSARTTLSLCGCHQDRMVLARYHLERWCLRGHEQCPHWLDAHSK